MEAKEIIKEAESIWLMKRNGGTISYNEDIILNLYHQSNSQQEAIKKLEEEKEEFKAKSVNKEYYRKRALKNKELLQDSIKENTKLKQQIKEMEEIIKEAINLPKGVEPHSYSDYKNK